MMVLAGTAAGNDEDGEWGDPDINSIQWAELFLLLYDVWFDGELFRCPYICANSLPGIQWMLVVDWNLTVSCHSEKKKMRDNHKQPAKKYFTDISWDEL